MRRFNRTAIGASAIVCIALLHAAVLAGVNSASSPAKQASSKSAKESVKAAPQRPARPARPAMKGKSAARPPLERTPQQVAALAARIDAHIGAAWKANNIEPAPPADDAEFLRRTYL